jgi:hypothetical protein
MYTYRPFYLPTSYSHPNYKPASFELKKYISEYRSEVNSFCNGPTVAFQNNAIS